MAIEVGRGIQGSSMKNIKLYGAMRMRMYDEILPNETYILALDTSKGGDKSNPSGVVLLRRSNSEQIGAVGYRVRPDVLATHSIEIAKYANNALIVVENNSYGFWTTNELQKKRYLNLYGEEGSIGVNTNSATKEDQFVTLLDQTILREGIILHDLETIRQCMGFIHDGKRSRAGAGKKDDLVIAIAIANYVNELLPKQLTFNYGANVTDKTKKTFVINDTLTVNRADYFDEDGNQVAHCPYVRFSESDRLHAGYDEEDDEEDDEYESMVV